MICSSIYIIYPDGVIPPQWQCLLQSISVLLTVPGEYIHTTLSTARSIVISHISYSQGLDHELLATLIRAEIQTTFKRVNPHTYVLLMKLYTMYICISAVMTF